jgi:flagellar hook-associated protein 1
MPGLMQGLEIARRAILAHQSALNITGNNLANISTVGYTRQAAILTPSPSERTPEGIIGTGVRMEGVQRARDIFLDVQMRDELGLAGKWQSRAQVLGRVESVLNEPSDQGLGALFDEFWNAWLDLSNQPEDSAARAVVVQRGQALAAGLQQQDSRLQSLLDATDVDLEQRVKHMNSLFSELAGLNAQIAEAETAGGVESNLRDRRDLILDELSRTAGTTNLVRGDGSVVVRMGGRTVVEGNATLPLTLQKFNDGGRVRVRVLFGTDKTQPSSLSGELAGVLEVRDQVMPEFMEKMDRLASALAENVNRLHQAGPSKLPFFRGERAADLAVAPEVAKDTTQINAGSTGDSGDNDIALAIAALRDARVLNRGTASLSASYRSTVVDLGSLGQQAANMNDSQQAAVQSLEAQRQSVIGVNLDEELTRMVTTQKAYEAAARVFSAVSEMLDVLLKM